MSRISTLTRFCGFMPAAPKIVRRASAVRPCRPITLPTSSGWTHSTSTINRCPSTDRTSNLFGMVHESLSDHFQQLLHDPSPRVRLYQEEVARARVPTLRIARFRTAI
jgi:hypothetical protein